MEIPGHIPLPSRNIGVDGIQGQDAYSTNWAVGDKSGILVSSGWDKARRINFASVSDGLSNTLMIGERPPSVDLTFGWIFGGGFDGSGVGDISLGARNLLRRQYPHRRGFLNPTTPLTVNFKEI